jgi:hypothetical protein
MVTYPGEARTSVRSSCSATSCSRTHPSSAPRVALAQESQVPRNALTQRHIDLKNEFYELVKARGATPDVEVRLRAEITRLKKTIANNNEELARLRADVPALVRVISLLTAENAELRELLETPAANVVPLRPYEH